MLHIYLKVTVTARKMTDKSVVAIIANLLWPIIAIYTFMLTIGDFSLPSMSSFAYLKMTVRIGRGTRQPA